MVLLNVQIFLYCFTCVIKTYAAAEMETEASTEEGIIALGHIIFSNILALIK